MGLISNLLTNLVGLTGAPNSNIGIQVIATSSLNLAIVGTPQTLYTPPSGNTSNIILIGGVLRDPNGIMASEGTQVLISINQQGFCILPEYPPGNGTTIPIYTFVIPQPVLIFPISASATVTGTVQTGGSTGNVMIDLIGYAVPAGS